MVIEKLILTELEKKIIDKKNVYLLDGWCLSLEDQLNKLDKGYTILNNVSTTSNLSKFKNFKKLKEKKLFIKKKIFDNLNKINKVKKSYRYWNICLGYWIESVIDIIYPKWQIVKNIDTSKNFEIKNFKLNYHDLIFETCEQFQYNLRTNNFDYWYNFILLKIFEKNDFKYKQRYEERPNFQWKINKKKIPLIFKIFSYFSKFIFLFKSKFKLVFINFQNLKFNLKILFKLKEIPIFFNFKLECKNLFDYKKRDKIYTNCNDKFEEFCLELFPKIIPKSFVENFAANSKYLSKNFSVKINNLFMSPTEEDLIKIFIAEHVENGSKLNIFQHGGNYGQVRWYPDEELEIETCDKFLTFGWNQNFSLLKSKIQKKKIYPFFSLNIEKKILYSRKSKKLLIVLDDTSISHPYLNRDILVPGIEYIKNIKNFILNLNKKIQKDIIIKPHPLDINTSFLNKFFDKFLVLNQNTDIYKCLKNTKLCFIPQNGTTLLQVLASEIPFILYWEKENFFFRKAAKEFYYRLEEKNVFFQNFLNASEFCNNNFFKIENWWNNYELQKILFQYKKKFVNTPNLNEKEIINKIKSILQ